MVTGGKANLTCGVRRCCRCATQYPIFTDQGSAHSTSNMFSVQKRQIMRFFQVYLAGTKTQGLLNKSASFPVAAHIS